MCIQRTRGSNDVLSLPNAIDTTSVLHRTTRTSRSPGLFVHVRGYKKYCYTLRFT
jgi:hypothetical protein